MMTVNEIAELLDVVEPDGRVSALQVGSLAQEVRTLLLTPHVDHKVIELAQAQPMTLIVAVQGLPIPTGASLRWDVGVGGILRSMAEQRLPLLALPPFYGWMPGGFDDSLARALNLREITPLDPSAVEPHVKLVTYVPVHSLEAVQRAAADAGAGEIGHYSNCAFRLRGEGTFLPRKGARPTVGRVGETERVEEFRLEMVAPQRLAHRVLRAVHSVHPYEQAAADVYPLYFDAGGSCVGRLGVLPDPMPQERFLEMVRAALPVHPRQPLRITSAVPLQVSVVAVLSGCDESGSALLSAHAQQADVYVAGELSQTDRTNAYDMPTTLVDAGQTAAAAPGLRALSGRLASLLSESGLSMLVSSELATA